MDYLEVARHRLAVLREAEPEPRHKPNPVVTETSTHDEINESNEKRSTGQTGCPELAWLKSASLPVAPFQLAPGVWVAGPARFYELLSLDLAVGAHGARWSAALNDVHRLQAIAERETAA